MYTDLEIHIEEQKANNNQENFEDHNWGTYPARCQDIKEFSSL